MYYGAGGSIEVNFRYINNLNPKKIVLIDNSELNYIKYQRNWKSIITE